MDGLTVLTEQSFVNARSPSPPRLCDENHEFCIQWREMYYNVGMVFVFGNVALLFVTVGLFVATVTIKKPH
jgi:hypothetical protein